MEVAIQIQNIWKIFGNTSKEALDAIQNKKISKQEALEKYKSVIGVSDVSCDVTPPLGTMLQLHILPDSGGDTMFSNMYAAYNELSNKFKSMLNGLIAIHESEHLYKGRYTDRGVEENKINTPSAKHPLIRIHPKTGKKSDTNSKPGLQGA